MIKKVSLLLFLATFLIISNGFAAQSTDDVTASPEMKDSIRQKILGDRAAQISKQGEYKIGHGDILSVTIFEEGDMAASSILPSSPSTDSTGSTRDSLRSADGVRVMMDGRISLKHIGDVEVVGLTLTELANYLKELYAIIFEDPIVTTTLVRSNSLRYTVIGNVQEPGIFYLDYPITVVQTIARSGGFTGWTNNTVTIIPEKTQGTDQRLFKGNTLKFDYDHFIYGKN